MDNVDTIEERFRDAYIAMVKQAGHRPEVPSDGLGAVLLDDDQIVDESVLAEEALRYAKQLKKQDDDGEFVLRGCTNWEDNKLFVYLLNAAQLCFNGSSGPAIKRLLELATKELGAIEHSQRERGLW